MENYNVDMLEDDEIGPITEILSNSGSNRKPPIKDSHSASEDDDTPYIPDSVINSLPDIIKCLIGFFQDMRERDVFVITMLTIFSGCFNKIKGIYKRREFQPNLFSFIVAPAASGKGAVSDARNVFKQLHKKIIMDSKAALAAYMKESGKKEKQNEAEATRPPFKMLFIPANITTSKLYHILQDCDGAGIIVETEADILAKMLKHEVGDTSSVLRNSFQNESLTFSRVTDNLYIEIERSKLAVALSGTPKQVPGIIHSAENGLFSRFIFYTYNKKPKWENVFPDKGVDKFSKMIGIAGLEVMNMIQSINENELIVTLSKSMQDKHNRHFSKKLEQIIRFTSEESSAILYRTGLMAFKIMMILTAIRKYDSKIDDWNVQCSDTDFNIALQLTDVFIEHSLSMLKTLPSNEPDIFDSKKKKAFYELLPQNIRFGRMDALNRVKRHNLDISEKTVSNYLRGFVKNGLLEKAGFNEYKKNVKKS